MDSYSYLMVDPKFRELRQAAEETRIRWEELEKYRGTDLEPVIRDSWYAADKKTREQLKQLIGELMPKSEGQFLKLSDKNKQQFVLIQQFLQKTEQQKLQKIGELQSKTVS